MLLFSDKGLWQHENLIYWIRRGVNVRLGAIQKSVDYVEENKEELFYLKN